MTEQLHAPTATATRELCERFAQRAGSLVRDRFGSPGVITDKPTPGGLKHWDVVTEVDHASEALLLEAIFAARPDALVLAEEGGLLAAAGPIADPGALAEVAELWLVDPLDGTVNFAHGLPHFCVSVACWRYGAPVAGAIVDPLINECFSFERAPDGAARALHNGVVVHVDHEVRSSRTLLTIGGGGPALAPLAREFQSWRRLGSAALALAWTGVGRCGAYVQAGQLHAWDWAVGVPFVEAAGGVVTNAGGELWHAPLRGTTGIIAAAPLVHAEISEIAAAVSAAG